MTALPTGRRGQALAVALAVLAAGSVWLGAAAPALDWYGARGERLAEQRVLAGRMAGLAATIPDLERRAAVAGDAAPAALMLLDGATDAIAGATLQQAVQDMAGRAGATIASAELLPAEPVASYRRISLHVTTTGTWPVVVGLLGAIAQGTPRMLVDDVSLRPSLALGATDARGLEASFTVIAFHAGPASGP